MKATKKNKIKEKEFAICRDYDGTITIRVGRDEVGGLAWGTVVSEINLGEAYVGKLQRFDVARNDKVKS